MSYWSYEIESSSRATSIRLREWTPLRTYMNKLNLKETKKMNREQHEIILEYFMLLATFFFLFCRKYHFGYSCS